MKSAYLDPTEITYREPDTQTETEHRHAVGQTVEHIEHKRDTVWFDSRGTWDHESSVLNCVFLDQIKEQDGKGILLIDTMEIRG